ncbi:class III signal peptide-containing protein [Methanocaldococcus sp.]
MRKAQLSLELILLIFGIIVSGIVISYYLIDVSNKQQDLGDTTQHTKQITYNLFGSINGTNKTTSPPFSITNSSENTSESTTSNETEGYAKITFVGESQPSTEYTTYDGIGYTPNLNVIISGRRTVVIRPKGSPNEEYILYPINGTLTYSNIEFWAQGNHILNIYNVKEVPSDLYVDFIIKGAPIPQIILLKDVKIAGGVSVDFEIYGGGNKTDAEVDIVNTTINSLDLNNIRRTSGTIYINIEGSNISNLNEDYRGRNTIYLTISNSWIDGKYISHYTKKIE